MSQDQVNHAEAHVINILKNLENIVAEPEKISGDFTATMDRGHKRIKVELRQVVNDFKVYIDVFFQLDIENPKSWTTVYRKHIEPNEQIIKAWTDAERRQFTQDMSMSDNARKEVRDILGNLLF